jgi:hypothetical protein
MSGDAASAPCECVASSRATTLRAGRGRRRRERAVRRCPREPQARCRNTATGAARRAGAPPRARLANTPPRARYATTRSRVGCPLSNDVALPLMLVGHVRAQLTRARGAGARRGESARGGGEPGRAAARLVRCGALAWSTTSFDSALASASAGGSAVERDTYATSSSAEAVLGSGATLAFNWARGRWGAARVGLIDNVTALARWRVWCDAGGIRCRRQVVGAVEP